jgi:hypothetical protein
MRANLKIRIAAVYRAVNTVIAIPQISHTFAILAGGRILAPVIDLARHPVVCLDTHTVAVCGQTVFRITNGEVAGILISCAGF